MTLQQADFTIIDEDCVGGRYRRRACFPASHIGLNAFSRKIANVICYVTRASAGDVITAKKFHVKVSQSQSGGRRLYRRYGPDSQYGS